ncbi:hypothetical protein SEPCBS57363_005166 [Sporothrix epigloea]|uniref:Uncharacterized protein n=1 Tax=Sporothrix epigloea TaxID=1892477 RepID=A0ABP0DW34_9PEZI
MVGPRVPLGKLTDHIKGMLGNKPTEELAPKLSLSDLRNGGQVGMFDDSNAESSSSDSDSSDSDSDGGNNKSSFLRKIGATNATASAAKSKTNGAVSTPIPAPKVPIKTNDTAMKKTVAEKEDSSSTSTSGTDSDSSDSDEEEKGAAKKPVRNGTKATARASTSSDTSSEGTSDSEADVEVAPKAKAVSNKSVGKPATAATGTSSTSTSGTTSPASSRESSADSDVPEADGDASDEDMADQSFAIDARIPGDSQVADSAAQFASQGFQLRRADSSKDASDVTRIFRQAKLEGKQLWYFTVPASVPITVVEQMAIPVAEAKQGKAILSHEGQDYGVSFDDALTSKTIKLLIPNKAGDKYSFVDRTIEKTMHLRRVTRFAQEDENAAPAIDPAVKARITAKKTPRQQPEGLRARFLPIGVNDAAAPLKKRKLGEDVPAAKTATVDTSGDESEAESIKKKAPEMPAPPSPKKAKRDKKVASAVPLPPIPGLTAVAPPVHKVSPVAPPTLPPSALKASAPPAAEKKVRKSKEKKNTEPKEAKESVEVNEDAMDIDAAEKEALPENGPEKKKGDQKKEKKDKKEKKEKKERKGKTTKGEEDNAKATPIASLSASASLPKKVTPVPLPRMF